ncbi:MAG: hypothetical protein KBF43_15095 [Dermatophilaceae bacterium]|nr:hypothetical protein [Dermatophilaceae bacterium]
MIAKAQARALPEGWTMTAKGLWHHANGARVEYTASTPPYRMTDPDGVYATAHTRAEAMAWAGGEEA